MQKSVVEVTIAWKERIIQAHHFRKNQVVNLGPSSDDDIFVPQPYVGRAAPFLRIANGSCKVVAPIQSSLQVIKEKSRKVYQDGYPIGMENGDLIRVDFGNGDYQVYIRYVPSTEEPILAPMIPISGEQVAAVTVTSLIMGAFISLMSSFSQNTAPSPRDEEHFGIVVFDPPKAKVPKIEVVQQEPAPVQRKRERPKQSTRKAPNPVPHLKNDGPAGIFGLSGIREKLEKLNGGNDVIIAANDSRGSGGERDGLSSHEIGKLSDTLAGHGTQTEGIGEIKTKSGAGKGWRGDGRMAGKGSVTIDAGSQGFTVEGSIDREGIRRTIHSILPQIKSCYERGLNLDPNLEGKIIVRFTIEERGMVRKASVPSSTLRNAKVESCVAERIRSQRFPDPPAGSAAEVDYPFVFGSQTRH